MRLLTALLLCLALVGCTCADLHPPIVKAHAIAIVHAEELAELASEANEMDPAILQTKLSESADEAKDLAALTGELFRLTGGNQ